MNTANRRKGFSLIEVVIAATIIVSIFSILYGTYFAISGSTKTVRAKQQVSQQARDTMTRLTRQIRCAYANYTDSTSNEKKTVSGNKMINDRVDYFYGDSSRLDEILHFVTTNNFFVVPQDSPQGLFDVTYKFNRNEGVFFVSQQRFVGSAKKDAKKQWVPIADNVQSFKLEYFDGQQWSDKWTFKDAKKLPNAVKIDLAFEIKTDRVYKCSTVANVYCGTDYDNTTVPGKLAMANNR